ncbi:MAG: aminoglycoside phosphotransferase family protein [Shinella sp.]|nr:aminoglycoside phosphotransferase family protein [Shinella sp.]
MTTEDELEKYRGIIVGRFAQLAGSRFSMMAQGWHSKAVEVDGRLVFKFPVNAVAEEALRREAALLAVIRPAVTICVPQLTLHEGPPLFSRHEKIEGEHLVGAQYETLPQDARQDLAERLALFYAELHALNAGVMKAAGARPVEPWLEPQAVLERALPVLPPDLGAYGEETVRAWRNLPPDPHGETYGFFDGHGWNMAFDHRKRRLNGIYDFADSGFGPLHQEFVYSNFISPDLTARIVSRYETITGRTLDRRRIDILTGAHRLSELAALADDPAHAPAMVRHVADWVAARKALD